MLRTFLGRLRIEAEELVDWLLFGMVERLISLVTWILHLIARTGPGLP